MLAARPKLGRRRQGLAAPLEFEGDRLFEAVSVDPGGQPLTNRITQLASGPTFRNLQVVQCGVGIEAYGAGTIKLLNALFHQVDRVFSGLYYTTVHAQHLTVHQAGWFNHIPGVFDRATGQQPAGRGGQSGVFFGCERRDRELRSWRIRAGGLRQGHRPGRHRAALRGDTNGLPIDTDGDGLPDYVEDADGDGQLGAAQTDPSNVDTDGDELSDGAEVEVAGTDPLDPASKNHN